MIEDSDKLKLTLILCRICKDEDSVMLSKYMHIVSRRLETEEFNKILRRTMRIVGDKTSSGGKMCQDWLMGELFTLYKIAED